MKRAGLLLALLLCPGVLQARQRAQGFCEQGGLPVTTQGLASTTKAQRSYPGGFAGGCTVTVFYAVSGVIVPTTDIYSDNAGTVKGNPFAADANGYWFFYADNGRYNVQFSGTGITTFAHGDYLLNDFSGEIACDASAQVGANAGVKIATCIAALPAVGGTVDARSLDVAQTIGGMTIAKSVHLLLGAGTYTLTGPLIISANNVRITGLGRFSGMDGLANDAFTAINYTGATSAIRFGDGVNPYQGIILEKFSLQVGNGVDGIDSLSMITNVRFHDLQVMGTALTGAGILPANSTTDFGWSFDGIHVKGFAWGADIQSGDDFHFRDSLFEFNNIGVELGTAAANTLPAIVAFGQGTRFGQNTTAGVHILSGRDITFDNVPCETLNAAGSLCLWVEGSAAPNIPRGIVVEDSWFNGNASVATNGIRLTRVDGMVLERNYFSQFGGKYILNDATAVARVYWRTQAYTDAASEVPANVTGFVYGLRYPDSNLDRVTLGPQDNEYHATAARYHVFGTGTAASNNVRFEPDASTICLGTGGAMDACYRRSAVNTIEFAHVIPDVAGRDLGADTREWDVFASSVKVGGATAQPISAHFSATASLDFTLLAAYTCEVLTVAVAGAVDGNTVVLGVPNTLADVDGATERTTFFGWVSGANTVSVRRCNVTAAPTADPAAATVRADVWQH